MIDSKPTRYLRYLCRCTFCVAASALAQDTLTQGLDSLQRGNEAAVLRPLAEKGEMQADAEAAKKDLSAEEVQEADNLAKDMREMWRL